MRKIQSEDLSLEVVHPDAAGIDIGNESHYVAVPPSRDRPTGTAASVHHRRAEGHGRIDRYGKGRLVAGVPHACFKRASLRRGLFCSNMQLRLTANAS